MIGITSSMRGLPASTIAVSGWYWTSADSLVS